MVEPPAHVRRVFGERPELAGAQRGRWEQLARDVEPYRLAHGVDVDRVLDAGAPELDLGR